MTVKLLLITMVAYLEMVTSQYYSPPAPSSYQPYNSYYPSPHTLPVPSMYAPQATPAFAPPASMPPMFAPFPATTFSSMAPPTAPLPNYTPTVAPPQVPGYQLMYPPIPYATAPPTYASIPAIPPAPKYPSPVAPLPKYEPPTAVAYYYKVPLEKPQEVAKERAKEIATEKSVAYPCPFCTGFADVPKNSKVPPPPPCSSVLPGLIDKIPTIKAADGLKIKELSKFAKPMPLLADLFEDKLSGKLPFDEDLLDGFLIGLGLGKYKS